MMYFLLEMTCKHLNMGYEEIGSQNNILTDLKYSICSLRFKEIFRVNRMKF